MAADSAGTQTVCLFIGGSVYFILWLWVTAHHWKKSGQGTKNKNWGRQMEECCLLACSSLCLKNKTKPCNYWCVEVRGQRVWVGSPSIMSSWNWTQVSMLGSRPFYQPLKARALKENSCWIEWGPVVRPWACFFWVYPIEWGNQLDIPILVKNNFKKLSVWPDYMILPADRLYISEASVLLSESEVNWLKYTGNNIAPHRLSYWYHCFFPEHSQSPPALVLNPPQVASSFPY